MKALAALLMLLPTVALAGGVTTEVLVLTAATPMPATAMSFRKAIEIQNLDPDPIFCAFSAATAVVNKSRRLAQYETMRVSGPSAFSVWCITAVNQVADAATIVMELE